MKEFIENKGQEFKSEKIPIKKTLTHQEFKKILDEDIKNQQETEENPNETPYQRMMRRKIENTRKQEQELKLAARQAHVGKMEHKQRKYEDLFGSSPTTKKNNDQTASSFTMNKSTFKNSKDTNPFEETNRSKKVLLQ